MKYSLSIVVILLSIALFNAAATDITGIIPKPVAGIKTKYVLTVVTGAFTTETTLIFNKSGDTATTISCKINKATAVATTADCEITLPEAVEYTISVGAVGTDAQTFKITPIAQIIKSIDPTKIAKDTKTTITLATVDGKTLGSSEKIQFSTSIPTVDTTPTAASCKNASDNKSTACEVTLATDGAYLVYLNLAYHGQTLTVSGGYLAITLGLLVSLILF